MDAPATETTRALAYTALTVLGFVTGLYQEVLFAGAAGGLVSLTFTKTAAPPFRLFGSFLTSVLCAGYLAPSLGELVASWTSHVVKPVLVSAFVVGLLANWVIPALILRAQKLARTWEPK